MKSSYEKRFQQYLDDNKIEFEYEVESFPVDVTKHTKYTPDFKIGDIFVEVKGNHRFVKDSLIKLEHFVEQYPHIKIVMVATHLDDPIPRWKRMTLNKFCRQNSIPLFALEDVLNLGPKKLLNLFRKALTKDV